MMLKNFLFSNITEILLKVELSANDSLLIIIWNLFFIINYLFIKNYYDI